MSASKIYLVTAQLVIFLASQAVVGGPTTPATVPSISVSGVWSFTLRFQYLQVDSVATLKQEGGKVTGTVLRGAAEKPDNISDGKITGRDFQMTVNVVNEVGTLRTVFRGKVDGNQIRGTAEVRWIDVPDHRDVTKLDWVATRAKDGETPPHGVR